MYSDCNAFTLAKDLKNCNSFDYSNIDLLFCVKKDDRFESDSDYGRYCEKTFKEIEHFEANSVDFLNCFIHTNSPCEDSDEWADSNYSSNYDPDIKQDLNQLEQHTKFSIEKLHQKIGQKFSELSGRVHENFYQLQQTFNVSNHFLEKLKEHVLTNDLILLKHVQYNTKEIADLKFPQKWQYNKLIDMQDYVDNFYFLLEKSRRENKYIEFTFKNKVLFLFPKYVAIEIFDYFKLEDDFNKGKDDLDENQSNLFKLDELVESHDSDFQTWMSLLAFNINRYILSECKLPGFINDLFDFFQINIDFLKKKIKKIE